MKIIVRNCTRYGGQPPSQIRKVCTNYLDKAVFKGLVIRHNMINILRVFTSIYEYLRVFMSIYEYLLVFTSIELVF